MRILSIIILLIVNMILIGKCFALTILSDSGPTTYISNYLQTVPNLTQGDVIHTFQVQRSKLVEPAHVVSGFQFPIKSSFTSGIVKPHKISSPPFPYPIFVIGSDETSINWAQQNAAKLKALHAIGIITNVNSDKEFEHVKEDISLPLIPASIDGLQELVKTSHYPFLLINGEVIQ